MADVFFRVILPMGLAGSLLYILLRLFSPLLAKLGPRLHKAALLAVCALLLLPLAAGVPLSPSGGASGIDQALAEAAPTAPLYRAGAALGSTLEAAAPANQPDAAPKPTGGTAAGATAGQTSAEIAAIPEEPPAKHNLPFWFAVLYFSGLGLLAAGTLARYLRLVQKLRRSSVPVQQAGQLAVYEDICHELNIRRPPLLCRSSEVSTPLLAGVLRPYIILPVGEAPSDSVAFALRHELTHYRRGDIPLRWLMLAASLLHWYNPLVWLLRRDFAQQCEECVDAAVAAKLDEDGRKAYASSLLDFASHPMPYPISGFASPVRQLKARLAHILQPAKPGKAFRFTAVASLSLLACVGLLAGCAVSAGVSGAAGSTGSSAPASFSLADTLDAGSLSQPAASSAPATDTSTAASTEPDPGGTTPSGMQASAAGLVNPVPDSTRSSRGLAEGHRGRDFNAPTGTAIYAVADGEVVAAGTHYSYGNVIILHHPTLKLFSLYAHNDGLSADVGDTVQQGQQITTVGSSGNSSGPHCHLELLLDDGNNAWDDVADDESAVIEGTVVVHLKDLGLGTLADPDDYINGSWTPYTPSEDGNTDTSALLFPVPGATEISRLMDAGHRGIDIRGSTGDNIVAAAAGTVTEAGFHYSYGNYVMIDHGAGLCTLYAHCDTLAVSEGQAVQAGELIATVGQTGNSVNTLCHLELQQDGALLNPLDYMTLPEGIQLPA